MKPPHFVFAGGGTAGHLFPGLAVAAELAAAGSRPRITFAGGRSLEAQHVAQAGFEHLPLLCAAAPRGPGALLQFLAKNYAGYRAARRFLRDEQASVVVGLGGYASLPTVRAALSLGVPLVLLEQNAFPGKVTRWLAPRAELVCTSFDATREHLRCVCPVRTTGNPLRAGFRPRRLFFRHSRWRRRLVVLGGSGGAASLNQHVPRALHKLRDRLAGWHVVHQTGPSAVDATRAQYQKLGIAATVAPFVQNLAQVLRASDLAVCRAGGTTLAELAATALPALLVPYPHAADDHQRRNAEVFAVAGAARLVDERPSGEQFEKALTAGLGDLLSDALKRQAMSSAMLRLARPDAAWQVASMIRDVSRNGSLRQVS